MTDETAQEKVDIINKCIDQKKNHAIFLKKPYHHAAKYPNLMFTRTGDEKDAIYLRGGDQVKSYLDGMIMALVLSPSLPDSCPLKQK